MIEKYGLFLLLAWIAEILGTISGFGSSILFVPIASLFFDFKMVLGVTAIFHVFSNLSKIVLFNKGIDKKMVFWLGIPAVFFVILGAYLTTLIHVKTIEIIMSICLLILPVFLFFKSNSQIQKSRQNLIIGGGISGFLAGMVGTGGAIRGITLLAFNLPKNVFIATSAVIDLGVDISRSVIYVWNGYFNTQYIVLVPFLIVIGFTGSWMGKIILKRTSEIYFRYIVLGAITVTTLFQLSSFLMD